LLSVLVSIAFKIVNENYDDNEMISEEENNTAPGRSSADILAVIDHTRDGHSMEAGTIAR